VSTAILTSGVALGVHVPGLLLARRLAEAGAPARVDVFERHLPADTRARITASMTGFHRDFRVAKAGLRMSGRNAVGLPEEAVARLLAEWAGDDVDLLVVLSGFWQPAAYRYAAGRPGIRVHACHVDSVASPSFAAGVSRVPDADRERVAHHDVWLLEEAAGSVARTIPVSRDDPLPWSARGGRLLAHGGGWGMGTYAADADALAAKGFSVDVVAYERADVVAAADGRRYFMLDPDWHPWHDDGFPPFGEVRRDGLVAYRRGTAHHDAFHLTREAVAVLSKPGGGTLMDSLAAATPVVLLEPFGDHEARNARLWERLGFGISLADWLRGGCEPAELERLHRNLLAARSRVASYPDTILTDR
jgi:hypothetical protein